MMMLHAVYHAASYVILPPLMPCQRLLMFTLIFADDARLRFCFSLRHVLMPLTLHAASDAAADGHALLDDDAIFLF